MSSLPSLPKDLSTNPPPLSDKDGYHVFVFYSENSRNDRKIADDLIKLLNERQFRCYSSKYFEADEAGSSVPEAIMKITDKSRRVITIVSKGMVQDEWAIFEIANSRTKSRERNEVIFIPILCDVDVGLIPSYFTEIVSLDIKDGEFWTKLFRALTGSLQHRELIEVGNIAHGIAWSYYYGYLALKLPGMVQRIRDSEFYKQRKAGIPILPKMVLVIPSSGKCPQNICKMDANITLEKGIIDYWAERAGKKRNYKSSVYKVKDPDSKKEYYVVLAYATAIMVLTLMEQGRTFELTAPERRRQLQLFSKKIVEITEHKNASYQHDKPAIFIEYDDDVEEPEMLSKVIARRVSDELGKLKEDSDDERIRHDVPVQAEYSQPRAYDSDILPALKNIPDEIIQKITITQQEKEDHTCFYISSHDKDGVFVKHLVTQLERLTNCKCFFPSRDIMGNQSVFEGMDESHKVIIVITKDYLNDERKKWEHIQALAKSYSDPNKRKVTIPVLHNVKSNEVPTYMREVNYVTTTDSLFWEKLVNMMKSDSPLWSTIPITDIAEGFVCIFWYRYLKRLVDSGLKQRILKYRKDHECFLLMKFIILLPKSGYCSMPAVDTNITEEPKLPTEITEAGNENRDYSSTVFKVKDPDSHKEYYVVMENATPLWTMYEMEQGLIAGLGPEDKAQQMREFNSRLNQILEAQNDCRDLFVTLEYDDVHVVPGEQHHLSRLIVKLIQSNI